MVRESLSSWHLTLLGLYTCYPPTSCFILVSVRTPVSWNEGPLCSSVDSSQLTVSSMVLFPNKVALSDIRNEKLLYMNLGRAEFNPEVYHLH